MRKKWVATVLSATALSFLAAGCGDDDDVTVPDTGVIPDSSVDSRVADATVDAAPTPDAAVASHSGTLIVAELDLLNQTAVLGKAARVLIGWSSTNPAIATAGLKAGAADLAAAPFSCFGYRFGDNTTTEAAQPTASGDAGDVTIAGFATQAAGTCTPGTPAGTPPFCAVSPATCKRKATGTMDYDCTALLPAAAGQTGNSLFPVQNFLPEAAGSNIQVGWLGGANISASASGNVAVLPQDSGFSTATLDKLRGTGGATAQKWDGTEDFNVALTSTDSIGVMVLRIEASDGDPAQVSTTDCSMTDRLFPEIGKCNAHRYAVINCGVLGANSTQTTTAPFSGVPAAKIAATFGATPAIAWKAFRVTAIKTGALSPRTTPGNPNLTRVAAGHGEVFFDLTP